MTHKVEFTNKPPTVAQCPKLELRLLARSLVEATRKYKQYTKEKNDETANNLGISATISREM